MQKKALAALLQRNALKNPQNLGFDCPYKNSILVPK
jgi:hypothetical protein